MAIDFSKYGTPVSTTETNGADFSKYGTPISVVEDIGDSKDVESAKEYGALFPAKTGESPLKAGFKAFGNIPTSAFNLAKNIGTSILHPIKTAKGLGSVAVGGVEKLIPGTQPQEEQFNQFTSFLKNRYGSLENLQRTATNDPFGFGTDILTLLQGGASVLGKTSTLNRGLSKTAQMVTKPVGKAVESVGTGISKTTRFGVSQTTGLTPETISNIIENPTAFTPKKLKETTRVNLGSSVKDAIDARLDNLSDIGSGYETIRQTPSIVSVPQGTVESVLNKYGIKVIDGKIKTTAEAKPLTTADKVALEDFINVYGNETQLSSNAFLNARQGLSQLSKYDSAKTGNLTPIARELRSVYDDFGKTQIKGLKELDELYAPEVTQLKQIKKDYLTPTGEFKDGAINKIANLTGVGKEQVLNRLEKIVPGVTQRIKIVKAAEDIEKASGLKVGTYARAGLGVLGVSTLNLPAILTAIVASPEIAVRLLRAYGYTKKTSEPIIKLLYGMANDVNNFRLPGQIQEYVSEYIKNPKLGMSIEDITRSQPELIPKGKNIKQSQLQQSSPKSTTKATIKSSEIPKTVKVWVKSKFSDKGAYAEIPVTRKVENITLYQGGSAGDKRQFWTPDKKYAEQFGAVREKTGTFYKVDNGNRLTDVYVEAPKSVSPQSSLLTEAKKYKSAEEFVKAQGTRTGVEVRDKIGTKLQDPYTAEYLPTNSDGTITLYHSTTKEGAEKIKQSGIFGSKTEGGDIYFTTNKKGYGGIGKDKDVVLAFNVDPKKIKFDDVYRGELHLKGNNTDIGGIKPVVIKTKSQLTDIWNKANGK